MEKEGGREGELEYVVVFVREHLCVPFPRLPSLPPYLHHRPVRRVGNGIHMGRQRASSLESLCCQQPLRERWREGREGRKGKHGAGDSAVAAMLLYVDIPLIWPPRPPSLPRFLHTCSKYVSSTTSVYMPGRRLNGLTARRMGPGEGGREREEGW